MALTVEPRSGEFESAIIADAPLDGPALAEALPRTSRSDGGSVQLWVRGLDGADLRQADAVAGRHGFTPYRDLWQMRVELPTEPSDLPVRGFDPTDTDAVVAVNRRAFSWHPEQGALTRAGLDDQMGEAWFDPAGLLIHEVDGEIVGFCWTKVHPDTTPPMGEIYVIGVDPAHHGRGIGGRLTRAGLDYLAGLGLDVGMLYVESDNAAAIHVYERIGFRHHHTDRAYRLDPDRAR